MRPSDLPSRLGDLQAQRRLSRQIARVEAHLKATALADPGEAPIVFFNASTRIHRLSLNAAFGLLAAWGVRLSGRAVTHVVCRAGMVQCPLGTERADLLRPPPCRHCMGFSRQLFAESFVVPLSEEAKTHIPSEMQRADLRALTAWEAEGWPLGKLVLPTMRWVLRRHDMPEDGSVTELFRRYLISALGLARWFDRYVESSSPRALVVFNGIMFPEAVARAVFRRAGIPVVTHEVGLRPFSAFFSHEDATFRRVETALDDDLKPEENARLDNYLEERFQGRFAMAGIRFWPVIDPLPSALRSRLAADGRAVVVFTNVVFDTSQVHANTIYPSMFAWLEDVREAIRRHPERLFVVRAHPDEDRPGKESRQSVQAWMAASGLAESPNVVFIPPHQSLSSYELLRSASLVLVYNSSVGLEGTIAGLPVLCAGRARYSEVDEDLLPGSRDGYRAVLEAMLSGEPPAPSDRRVRRARRFLEFELFRASLDFSGFLEERRGHPGMVEWRDFEPAELAAASALQVVVRGIVDGSPFVVPASGPESNAIGPKV